MEEELKVTEEAGRFDRKQLKKDVSHMSGGLILYTIFMFVIVFVDMFWRTAFSTFRNGGQAPTEEELMKFAESGTSMILGVGIGLLFLALFMRKRASVKEMFQPKKKMTAGTFFRLLTVFMAAQFIFSCATELLEAGLNLIGFSAMASIEAATGMSVTFSMFLYASFVAPIGEELVYRGFMLKPLEKYGKLFAIVISALLFGVMHANLPQSMFAFCVGLVLAYTAIEYSVIWAIALHVANNFVFAELMSRSDALLGETGGLILSGVVIFGFFIGGLIILWKYRRQIRQYIAENRTEKGAYKAAFTTVTFLLFVGFNLLLAFSSLQKLP